MTARLRSVSFERWLLLALAAIAFILSYSHIVRIGEASGMGDLSVLFPLVVDGGAVIGARTIEATDRRLSRLLPWVLLSGMASASIWINALAAEVVVVGNIELELWQAQLFSATPAAVGLIAFECSRIIQRADERRAKAAAGSAPATPGTEAPESPETRSPAALTADQEAEQIVAEARTALTARPAAPRDGGRTHQQARTWWETHPGPTPKDMARAMGLDPDTAARWAEQFEQEEISSGTAR